MKDSFTEFHRLIGEANELIAKVADHPDDTAIRVSQLLAIAALCEAQKQALHLEKLLNPEITIPPQ